MIRDEPVIPCTLLPEVRELIASYATSLRDAAPSIGNHGLDRQAFCDSGLFHAAIEKLRGTQAASRETKRAFVDGVLSYMKSVGAITDWAFTGGGERHDYTIEMRGSRRVTVETKGCLDGNNTNIYVRPPDANEFIIWSLCQNPGADPRHNAWSGIHTRLGAEIIARPDRVDGLVIWDMLCGTAGRPCPKLLHEHSRGPRVAGRKVPPPCIDLFPRTRPEPRNIPNPEPWKLADVKFLQALHNVFRCGAADVTEVGIEAQRSGVKPQRRTVLLRAGTHVCSSHGTTLKRATL